MTFSIKTMLNKFSYLILSISISCCFVGKSAADCTCPEKPEMKQAYEVATAVFVGRVEKVAVTPLKPGYSEIKISIFTHIKTAPEIARTESLSIFSKSSQSECGINFHTGQDYLIYAEGNPAALKVTSCSRSGVLDNLIKEVDELKIMSNPELYKDLLNARNNPTPIPTLKPKKNPFQRSLDF
jgi:hypothetical protein